MCGSARTHQHMSGLRIHLPAAFYAFLSQLEHLLRGFRVFLAAVLRRGLWLLRTVPCCAHTRFAGYMKGIHPKAFNWAELELLFLSPRAGFPPLKISLSLSLSLSPRRVYPTMCHCSGPGETWTRVGGRYFSLSGSVVSDCAGPLSGFFGVVLQSGAGDASRDHGGAPLWRERTNYSDYMWPADG